MNDVLLNYENIHENQRVPYQYTKSLNNQEKEEQMVKGILASLNRYFMNTIMNIPKKLLVVNG